MDAGLKKLDIHFREVINTNVGNINYGGCCVFASLIAPYLSKVGKVQIKVVGSFFDDEDANITAARKKIKCNTVREWNKHGVFFGHVLVAFKYKGKLYYIDSRGIRDQYYTNAFAKGSLTLKEARELAASRGWNYEFDRQSIPTLREHIDQFFKQNLRKTRRGTKLVA